MTAGDFIVVSAVILHRVLDKRNNKNYYPAAGLIDYYTGDKLVLINRDATPYDGQANLIFRDKIGEVLSAI